ncbi:MAG TPA: DUF1800 domain-containing protein [Thermoleophilaceae bacterium]|nr:DUF1800 domain-containing protein [Thermoleophilaceae bacterium]
MSLKPSARRRRRRLHKHRHKHVSWHRHSDGKLHKHVRWHTHWHDHRKRRRRRRTPAGPPRPPANATAPVTTPLPDPHPLPSPETHPDPRPDPAPQPPDVPPTPAGTPPPPERTPSPPASRLSVYSGPFGVAQAERLLWRAGFGPTPGQAELLASKGLEGAVHSLTRPAGPARLVGPEPTVNGAPLNLPHGWGHDHLWWLDRMVRSDQPLVERIALVWHDWFASSAPDGQGRTIAQSELFRRQGLGSFRELLLGVTSDPAMLVWLNGIFNWKWRPDENYARELMELFTLGADRGAYTEADVREMARALTGWRADWNPQIRHHNFRFDPSFHDTGTKTIFGQSGAFDWRDACRLCCDHPMHASFVVRKLWSYFIPTEPSPGTQADLEALYLREGQVVRPLVEAILKHPDLYEGAPMVKPPVVFAAGLLRSQGRGVTTLSWTWLCEQAGQRLFYPPNVDGWDHGSWLNTTSLRARWLMVTEVLGDRWIDPWSSSRPYSSTEDAGTALGTALRFWGDPVLTRATWDLLLAFASSCIPLTAGSSKQGPYRAMRQNALRQLIAACPDAQVC